MNCSLPSPVSLSCDSSGRPMISACAPMHTATNSVNNSVRNSPPCRTCGEAFPNRAPPVQRGGGAGAPAGRDQLKRGFEARQRQTDRVSRHVCTTFDLSRTESDRAEGTVYLTLYRYDLGDGEQRPAPLVGPALVGAYHDVFERGPDGWRIAQRRLVVDFLAEES